MRPAPVAALQRPARACPRAAATAAPAARPAPLLAPSNAAVAAAWRQRQRRQIAPCCALGHSSWPEGHAPAPFALALPARQRRRPRNQQQQQQQQGHARRAAVGARALALAPTPSGAPEPLGGGDSSSSGSGGGGAIGSISGSGSGGSSGAGCAAASLGWNTAFGERFTLGRELGRGSFGIVRVAVHNESGREYAVKILKKGSPGGSPSGSSGGGGSASASGSASATATGGAGFGFGAVAAGGVAGVLLPAGCGPSVAGSPAGGGSPSASGAGGGSGSSPRQPGIQHLDAIEREVTAWMSVQASAYVARLEGLYEDEEHAYLVQELVGEGVTLKALLEARGGKLPEAEAAAVMRGVLDVLVEAHHRDYAYGDVKPANFLLASAPGAPTGAAAAGGAPAPAPLSVRAVDFGCARQVPLTRPCGSPLYMAPETAGRRWGTASDVWSAGVMLYQMLTNRIPFYSNLTPADVRALPPYTIVAAVRSHDISYPRDLWGGLSPEARVLVASMLERDPAARITAAEALAHPWFARALGARPEPTGRERAREEALHNRVEFSARVAALHL